MKIEANGLGRSVALTWETIVNQTTMGDGLKPRPND
jgi:hypothetical protein